MVTGEGVLDVRKGTGLIWLRDFAAALLAASEDRTTYEMHEASSRVGVTGEEVLDVRKGTGLIWLRDFTAALLLAASEDRTTYEMHEASSRGKLQYNLVFDD
jgi:uncharacterized protein (AIM24 family)